MNGRIRWHLITLVIIGLVNAGPRGAAASPDVVFSQTYARVSGSPTAVRETLKVCDPNGRFVLIVQNGPGERSRVTDGAITLNGRVVVSPSDLGPRVATIERWLSDLRPSNTLEIRVGGRQPGAILVKVLGWQTCIRFTDPLDGSTVHDPAIVVEGEVQAPGQERVTLESALAVGGTSVPWALPVAVSHGRFAARVRLMRGENRFVARVTNALGRSVETTLRLTFEPNPLGADEAPTPDVSPTSGFAPLAVTFTASEVADPSVVAVDLDVDGDGRPDFTRTDFAAPPHQVTYTYATEGLYVAALTIQDQTGLTRVTRVPIHVIPVPDLAATWETFRRALARADLDAALEHIALEARDRYRRVFEDLRPDLRGIAGAFGPFVPQVVTADYATGWVVKGGASGGGSYLVTFLRDGDGVWRLASL